MRKRYNIGLVVANITDSFSSRVTKGAMAEAESLDANLFVFPMKYLDIDYDNRELDQKYEYQYNVLMYYAAQAKLDYLIVCTGTVAYLSNEEKRRKFLSVFDGTPLLNVASDTEGYDYLIYDNSSGITDAVNYLATNGCKHICMMTGDTNNIECSQRFEAYKAALENNGLEFSERMVIESDVSNLCILEAGRLLDRNPECDAVLCANDDMATVMYELLRLRGKVIGRDVFVVGFDDMPYASQMDPPLASVKADAFELGAHAVKKVINKLNGITDDDHLHKTEFIPRASCSPETLFSAKVENVFIGDAKQIAEKMMRYIYQDNVPAEKHASIRRFCGELVNALHSRFISRTADESDIMAVIDLADVYFAGNRYSHLIIHRITALIDASYVWLMKNAPAENSALIQRLFRYFFTKISSVVIGDLKKLDDKHHEHIHDTNIFVRDTFMLCENAEWGYSKMLRKLFAINVRSSFLFLHREPVVYHKDEVFGNENDWQFMSYQEGMNYACVPEWDRDISVPEIFRNSYISDEIRHTFIIADLYSMEQQYGMLLCEPESSDFFDDLELVIYQISSAVRLIRLIDEQEKTMDNLHASDLALEGLPETDKVTGICNRTGFYKSALDYIGKYKGKEFIVCYAKLDNLKHIDDTFGHSEYNFAVKSMSECLTSVFGDKGIAARMGEDVFAAVIISSTSVSTEKLKMMIRRYLDRVNSGANKPYSISSTVGMCISKCYNSHDLKTALDKAAELI